MPPLPNQYNHEWHLSQGVDSMSQIMLRRLRRVKRQEAERKDGENPTHDELGKECPYEQRQQGEALGGQPPAGKEAHEDNHCRDAVLWPQQRNLRQFKAIVNVFPCPAKK